MISCTSGKIIDAGVNTGDRKNLRISRSTIAIIRFIVSPEPLVLCPSSCVRIGLWSLQRIDQPAQYTTQLIESLTKLGGFVRSHVLPLRRN